MSIINYLFANNEIPFKSITFKSSCTAIPVFCNKSYLKLYSVAYEELLANLKSLTTLMWTESKSATHYKEIISTLNTKSSGLGYT
jgi:hypothetical protein